MSIRNSTLTVLPRASRTGGVAYLDEKGRQTDGQAAMLAFAGAVMKKGRVTWLDVVHRHELPGTNSRFGSREAALESLRGSQAAALR